jgi:O-antigen ligase
MMRKIALLISLALVFTIPWETAITISSLGTLTKLIGFGAAGIWIASVLINGTLRKFHAYHIAVLAFMLFNLASIFWTVSYDLTMMRIKTYLQLAILTWMLWDLFTTPESLHMAMQAFIFGAYMTIASEFINLLSGRTISLYEVGRFTGAGQNANELSLILSLSLPLAWYLATTQKPGYAARILKVVNFAFIPLALFAAILTGSRTALVTNIPGLLYIAGTMNKLKPVYRILVFAIIVTAFIVIWPLIPQATFNRLSTIGNSIAGNDLGGRTRLWRESFAIFLNHPFLGIGSDALGAPGQLGAYAHNTFLSIMAELGLVGLFLFLGVLSIVVFQAISQPKPFAILWVTVIAIWLIGAVSLTWEYTKGTWFFLTLVVISAGVYNRKAKPIESPFISDISWADSDVPIA